MSSIFKCPLPPEKGAYCFETVGHWYVGLSICRPSVARSISFDPITWSIPNLKHGVPSMSRCTLSIFSSHVKGQGQTTLLSPSVVRSISFNLLTWSIPNLVQGLSSISRSFLLISGHIFKSQGQITLLSSLCCPLNTSWPLHLINTKLGAGVALNK